jgi:hypothetical protein
MDEIDVVRVFRRDVSAPSTSDISTFERSLIMVIAEEDEQSSRWYRQIVTLSHRRLTAATVLAVAALIGVVLASWPGKQGQLSFVEAAAAAIGDGPVTHVVIERESTARSAADPQIIDLKTGTQTPVTWQTEMWLDDSKNVLRIIQSFGGYRALDHVSAISSATADQRLNPSVSLFLADGYQKALRSGTAVVVRKDEVDGVAVNWVSFRQTNGVRMEVAVRTDNFVPVRLRQTCDQCTQTIYDVRTLEYTSYRPENFHSSMSATPVNQFAGTPRFQTIAVSDVGRRLGAVPLTPGDAVDSLPLNQVQLVTAEKSSGPVRAAQGERKGVVFLYGDTSLASVDYVSIAEAVSVDFAFPGFGFESTSSGPVTHERVQVPIVGKAVVSDTGVWSISLEKAGMYVEVESPRRDLALAAARELAPAVP